MLSTLSSLRAAAPRVVATWTKSGPMPPVVTFSCIFGGTIDTAAPVLRDSLGGTLEQLGVRGTPDLSAYAIGRRLHDLGAEVMMSDRYGLIFAAVKCPSDNVEDVFSLVSSSLLNGITSKWELNYDEVKIASHRLQSLLLQPGQGHVYFHGVPQDVAESLVAREFVKKNSKGSRTVTEVIEWDGVAPPISVVPPPDSSFIPEPKPALWLKVAKADMPVNSTLDTTRSLMSLSEAGVTSLLGVWPTGDAFGLLVHLAPDGVKEALTLDHLTTKVEAVPAALVDGDPVIAAVVRVIKKTIASAGSKGKGGYSA